MSSSALHARAGAESPCRIVQPKVVRCAGQAGGQCGGHVQCEEEEPGPQYWVEQSSCAGHVRVGLAGRANTPQLSQHSGQSASHPLEERSHTDRARVLLPAAGITLVLPGVMRGAARWTATLSAVRSVWIPVLITACWLVVRPL